MLPLNVNKTILVDGARANAGLAAGSGPVLHVRPSVTVRCVRDYQLHPASAYHRPRNVPVRLVDRGHYGLHCYIDDFSVLRYDWQPVRNTEPKYTLELEFRPISLGMFRFLNMIELSSKVMSEQWGFTEKEMDDVKQLFSMANVNLLLLTYAVSFLHMFFEFLAFKVIFRRSSENFADTIVLGHNCFKITFSFVVQNDVQFYKNRKSFVGISKRTLLINLIFGVVIFLYLLDSAEV